MEIPHPSIRSGAKIAAGFCCKKLDLHQLQVMGDCEADAVEAGVDFASAGERGLDVRDDVFVAYFFENAGLGEDLGGLIARTAEDQSAA